ncbi:hypothetical protein DPMN_127736 [Dreissena polymorpha]|uniref:Reverse transcriptase domain-containing protein n=1 Tax=Dreissena polymorpha TaxID=45954 RepID=A0A9D4H1S8_DREPO|nr:hypothetical protein DPMN_127736 [Dreissena polymorpha]
MSDNVHITSGVPRGTGFGPILFLTYISHIDDYIKHTTQGLGVDNSIIYENINNLSDAYKLQLCFEAAGRWEHDSVIQFYHEQGNHIIFSYKLHDQILENGYLPNIYVLHSKVTFNGINILTQSQKMQTRHSDFFAATSKFTHQDHTYKAKVRP